MQLLPTLMNSQNMLTNINNTKWLYQWKLTYVNTNVVNLSSLLFSKANGSFLTFDK